MSPRIALIALAWVASSACAFAQTPQSEIVTAYEARDYHRCLSIAGYIERTSGPTSLTRGLAALSLHALGDEEATAPALDRYQAIGASGTPYDSQLASLAARYREKAEKKKEQEKRDQEKAAADEKQKAQDELKKTARSADQGDPLANAIERYSTGDYAAALGIVAALELQQGPSPRLESLRALCLHEQGTDDTRTFRSLERYWELTRDNPAIFNNENHRELMTLLDDYRKKLEEQKKKEAEERKKKADEIAQAAERRAQEAIRKQAADAQRQLTNAIATLPQDKLSKLNPSDYQFLKSAGANPLAKRFDDRIFTVEKHLLSGSFRLDMGADSFRSLYQSRVSAFKTESPIVRLLQSQSPAEWVEFPFGFVVSLSAHGSDRLVLDHTKMFDFDPYAYDDPPVWDEKIDGKAVVELTRQLTATGLKPFLGLNENWSLASADIHRNDVYILSFATTLSNVASHSEVLKKLTDVFGPLQPFKGAPSGFLEYARDDGLRGGRFLFPQANGITFDGRVFQSKETLVDSPWIIELRVSRLLLETALYHEFYSVDAHKYSHAPFSRRYAQQVFRESQSEIVGLKAQLDGRDCVLVKPVQSFYLYENDDGDGATYIVKGRDEKTGDLVTVTYSDVRLSSVRNVDIISRPGWGFAYVENVHLTRPALVETTVISNGEASSTTGETLVIPFLFKDYPSPINEPLIASLPPPQKLSKDDFERYKSVFGYSSLFDRILFRFFQEADRQGKFDDAFYLGKIAPESAKPALFARAAKSGNVDAMDELRKLYSEKWVDRKATEQDQQAMLYWGIRAADAGHADSLRFMMEYFQHRDLLATERWMKSLKAMGKWKDLPFSEETEREITRRADMMRKLAPLPIEAKAIAFTPVYDESRFVEFPESALGKKFKTYATPEKQYTRQEKAYNDRTGKKVVFYQRGEAVQRGPRQVWVNRKGIVIGEYYLLDTGRGASKRTYEDHLAYLTQFFGAEHLTSIAGGNVNAGVAVSNGSKTIELLLFDDQCNLKYIDHTLE